MSSSWHDFLFASLDHERRDDGRQAAAGAVGAVAVGAGLRLSPAERPRAPGADGGGERGARSTTSCAAASAASAGSSRAWRWRSRRSPWRSRGTTTPTRCSSSAAWPRFGARCGRWRTGATQAGSCSPACAWGWASRRRWAWRCVVVPGHRRGLAVGRARRRAGRLHALRQLLGGRGRDGARRRRLAGARRTDPGGRPPVGVGDERQQRALADLRIQRPRPRRRPDRAARAASAAACSAARPGPLRLLNSALGGQAGWLLGFALVSGLGILVASRLRRSDPRTGWLLAVGGAFLTTAVLFSAASGIFHPYYVSLLAPFAGRARRRRRRPADRRAGRAPGSSARWRSPRAWPASWSSCGSYPGQLHWLPAVLIVVGALAALALLALHRPAGARWPPSAQPLAALLLAPSVWAVDTLGYAASGTFPAGGPASVEPRAAAGRSAGSRRRAGTRAANGRRPRSRRCGAPPGLSGRTSGGPGGPGGSRAAPPAFPVGRPGLAGGAGGPGFGGGLRRRTAERRCRSGRAFGERRSITQGPRLRQGARRRARSRSPASRAPPGDHRRERRRGRDRRLLRPRERRERVVARTGGGRGKIRWVLAEQAGAQAPARACRATRAPARSSDGGGGEGLPGGDALAARSGRAGTARTGAARAPKARSMTARAARRSCSRRARDNQPREDPRRR